MTSYNIQTQENCEDTKSGSDYSKSNPTILTVDERPMFDKQIEITKRFKKIFKYLNNGQGITNHSKRSIFEKKLKEFPLNFGEVAFYGNTNVGKSTLINHTIGNSQLLNTSCLQETSFFWELKFSNDIKKSYQSNITFKKNKQLSKEQEFQYMIKTGKHVGEFTLSKDWEKMDEMVAFVKKMSKHNHEDPIFDASIYSIYRVELIIPSDTVTMGFNNPQFSLLDLPGIEDLEFQPEILEYIQYFNYKQFPVILISLQGGAIKLAQYDLIRKRFQNNLKQRIFVVFTNVKGFKIHVKNEEFSKGKQPNHQQFIEIFEEKIQTIAQQTRDFFSGCDLKMIIYDPQEKKLMTNYELKIKEEEDAPFGFYRIDQGFVKFQEALNSYLNIIEINIPRRLSYSLIDDLLEIFMHKQEQFKGEKAIQQVQDQIVLKSKELQDKYKKLFSQQITHYINNELPDQVDEILATFLQEDKKNQKVRLFKHKFMKKASKYLVQKVSSLLQEKVQRVQEQQIEGFTSELVEYLNKIYELAEKAVLEMAEKEVKFNYKSNLKEGLMYGTTSGLLIAVSVCPNVFQFVNATSTAITASLLSDLAASLVASFGIGIIVTGAIVAAWTRKKQCQKLKKSFLEKMKETYIIERLQQNFDEEIEKKRDEISEVCSKQFSKMREDKKLDFYLRLVHNIDQKELIKKLFEFRKFLNVVFEHSSLQVEYEDSVL